MTNLELHVADAQTFDGGAAAWARAVLARWGLMYMEDPVAALRAAHRALVPGGRLVAAVWVEPERATYFTLPRRILENYRSLPPEDPGTAGPFRYARIESIQRDFGRTGFVIEHVEELFVPVMEATTAEEIVAWARAFGLTRLMDGLPADVQGSWERDFARAAEPLRTNGVIQLGGITRLVVASAARAS